MPKRPDVRKRQFLRDLEWNEGVPKNPKAASVVEDRQLELLQTGGIADDVHPDDLPVREREAQDPDSRPRGAATTPTAPFTIAGRANRVPREKPIAPPAQVCAPRTSVAPSGASDGSMRTTRRVEDARRPSKSPLRYVEPAQCRREADRGRPGEVGRGLRMAGKPGERAARVARSSRSICDDRAARQTISSVATPAARCRSAGSTPPAARNVPPCAR